MKKQSKNKFKNQILKILNGILNGKFLNEKTPLFPKKFLKKSKWKI